MTRVVALGDTATTEPGYRVHTHSRGDEYVTILREIPDADERTVEVTERYRIDGDTGDRVGLNPDATDAVEEALEDRGVSVA